MHNTLSEAPMFLLALYGGLVIGALYSLLRCASLIINNKLITNVIDLMFYAAAGVISGVTLILSSGGSVRAYLIAAIVIGALLFYFAFGKPLFLLIIACQKKLTAKTAQKRARQIKENESHK